MRGLKVSVSRSLGLTVCNNCSDPRHTGSIIDAWISHHAPHTFDIAGVLVYAVPNDASATLSNPEEVHGNVVLIDRGGGVPLVDKVLRGQEAGASVRRRTSVPQA